MSAGKEVFFEDGEKEMEEDDRHNGDGGGFDRLPEEFVSQVLALTSPSEACRAALVSSAFYYAAASDIVWDAFLPPDYADILSRAVDRVEFSSKRELFFRLCDPILIDGDKMSFFLERSSGKKCFMLSARALTIRWGDNPACWSWDNHPESRFSEVAEFSLFRCFDIRGKLNAKLLSRHTEYATYLVYKRKPLCAGFDDHQHQEASVKLGALEFRNHVCLDPDHVCFGRTFRVKRRYHRRGSPPFWLTICCGSPTPPSPPQAEEPKLPLPMPPSVPRWPGAVMVKRVRRREDGWLERELGVFENEEGDDGEVEIRLREVKRRRPKNGIIIEGIELRPKH